MTERGKVRAGGATIEYELRRSKRREKTIQLTVEGGVVRVAAPLAAPARELREFVRGAGALDTRPHRGGAERRAVGPCRWRDVAIPGPQPPHGSEASGRAFPTGPIRSLAATHHGAARRFGGRTP